MSPALAGHRTAQSSGCRRTYALCVLLFAAQSGSAGCADHSMGLGFVLSPHLPAAGSQLSGPLTSACSTTCIAARRGVCGVGRRAVLLRTLQPLHPLHMGKESERVRSFGDEDENLVEKYRNILNNVEKTTPMARDAEAPKGFFSNFMASAKVKPCTTDYDCNPVSLAALFALLILQRGRLSNITFPLPRVSDTDRFCRAGRAQLAIALRRWILLESLQGG